MSDTIKALAIVSFMSAGWFMVGYHVGSGYSKQIDRPVEGADPCCDERLELFDIPRTGREC